MRVLIQTGARRGELFNMRLKDVQFDQYSAIVFLHGKTGTRQRRVYGAEDDPMIFFSTAADETPCRV
jgi:hypothetical protein